ncbi:MAG: type III-A CRISPR-associated protein Cas10/Csm1 [Phascolarctobacterium sp.]|nr:type III-A CRISPR-associated protein Cas10/Csm1 [Phascolarctobacterium sp.]
MKGNDTLVKSAILHDIGKICIRADHSLGEHSKAGCEFLKQFLQDNEESKIILRCIRNHHASNLKSAKLIEDDLSYIVYEADNIAAGMDRRSNEGDDKGFDAKLPLSSVFNIFGGTSKASNNKFFLRGMNPDENFNYPVQQDLIASSDKYKELVEELKSNFQRGCINEMGCNELLRIYEDITSYIPSSTNKEEVCDISLFIHSKITAAIASCMKHYFDAQGITDFKNHCFLNNKSFRTENAFMLVSGDVSGIQDFIYTIPSKGALKSLRGRSFYLELMVENFIDELLECLGLTRANVLYSGGGHFYLLAPATEEAKIFVKDTQDKCNHWLLENFGTKLYMAVGLAECSANELMVSDKQRSVFATVSQSINFDKLNRYDVNTLSKLFVVGSEYNSNIDNGRECGVCHTSSANLQPYDEGNICPICLGLLNFGKKILDGDIVFVVSDEDDENGLPVFGRRQQNRVYALAMDKLDDFDKNIIRIYSKNQAVTGKHVSTRLWLADYTSRNTYGDVLDFKELAEKCCDGKSGIKRLGVLRADVDNLGAAFISGFVNPNSTEPLKYATFSRYADLSRDMTMFFKLAVDKICQGSLKGIDGAERKAFRILGLEKVPQRQVHIVYSGGDDMFLVGAWDELIEVAVDIREAFNRFTGGKLSFSAGMAMFRPGYPISKMAELTGMLESAAKDMPEKDSIALFGFDTEQKDAMGIQECKHIYKWEDFTNDVCGSKLKFLLDNLSFDDKEANKLKIGKNQLYRLMHLIEECDRDGMSLARYAYTLARMQPSKKDLLPIYERFSSQMYAWMKNKKDRQALNSALNLLVYYLREDKED